MQLVSTIFLLAFVLVSDPLLECRSLLQISQFLPTFLGLLILWMVVLSLHPLVLEKKPALLVLPLVFHVALLTGFKPVFIEQHRCKKGAVIVRSDSNIEKGITLEKLTKIRLIRMAEKFDT